MSTYTRQSKGIIVNSSSSGYAARLQTKQAADKVKEQTSEIETLKTHIANLQSAVEALQNG